MISSVMEKIEREIENTRSFRIIVEGKRDKEVMEKLGFKNVISICDKKLDEILSFIDKDVLILTDFDEEGEKIAKRLEEFLTSRGVKVRSTERRIFRKIFNVKKIEELKFILKFMEDDYNGKACSINDKIFNRSRILMRRNSRKA